MHGSLILTTSLQLHIVHTLSITDPDLYVLYSETFMDELLSQMIVIKTDELKVFRFKL